MVHRRTDEIITLSELRSVLSYDRSTGTFVWIKAVAAAIKVGSIAGSINNRGRRIIQIRGRLYTASRLAWLYSHGEWPQFQIDHENLVRSDDRLDNLRPATSAQNARNRRTRKDNTSGHKGVHWHTQTRKWIARAVVNGERKHLGLFSSLDDAIKAYRAAAIEHYGEFARFD